MRTKQTRATRVYYVCINHSGALRERNASLTVAITVPALRLFLHPAVAEQGTSPWGREPTFTKFELNARKAWEAVLAGLKDFAPRQWLVMDLRPEIARLEVAGGQLTLIRRRPAGARPTNGRKWACQCTGAALRNCREAARHATAERTSAHFRLRVCCNALQVRRQPGPALPHPGIRRSDAFHGVR